MAKDPSESTRTTQHRTEIRIAPQAGGVKLGAVLVQIALLAVVLVTSTISGVFGMAGGLMLMGALTFAMTVPAAMVSHGLIQLASNGWRAVLHRRHIRYPIMGYYALGSLLVAGLLWLVRYAPSRAWVYLLLGLVPALTWLPSGRFLADAARPRHAALCGFLVTGLNVAAGVSGPVLDVFFVRTKLSRHEIVASKAATQTLAHIAKSAFYGLPLLALGAETSLPAAWFFGFGIALAMLGAVIGARILDTFDDQRFRAWSRYLVSAIGLVYLGLAVREFQGGLG